MTNEQNTELSQAILKRVIDNDAITFEFITHYDMYKATKLYHSAAKKLVKTFKNAKDKAFAEYFQTLNSDYKKSFIAFNEFLMYKACWEFFKKELSITKDMIKEYKVFLWSNTNLFKQLILGKVRDEEDMIDYRTLPWKLF